MHPTHGWIPLELKSHRWQMRSGYGEEWTDDIPLHEIVQCQWQMHLLGAKYCVLAVMFGLDETDMQCYMVEYAEDIALGLDAQAVAFINNHILAFNPPEPTGSDADTEVIKRMYRHPSDKILQAGKVLDDLCVQLKEIKKVTAADEEKDAELINKIKNFMGDEYSVLMSSVGKFTWNKAKDGSKTDWEKVAKAANASAELIAEHTKVTEGSRRFLLPK
jgi:predicted phage-related endonuclease